MSKLRVLLGSKYGKWQGILVVVGGILVHLSIGTIYTFGNLSPYLTSYMHDYGSAPQLTATECAWIFALSLMGQGLTMSFGGLMERKIGPKLTTLLGGWCMSLGVLLTFFTVKHSFFLTVITYGAVVGAGVGIAYAIPLSCAVKWFPERKGLINGIIVAGFGGGAFIFNQVQTAFINPFNLQPDKEMDGEKYFTQASVLDQVPLTFFLLGSCYAVMQLIGSLLLCSPPLDLDSETITDSKKQEKQNLLVGGVRNSPLAVDDSTHGNKVEVIGSDLDDEMNFQPLEMLKSCNFYLLWLMFVFVGPGVVCVSTLYKAYGQTFISDDMFMAIVGSFGAIFNAGGRIFWGIIADKFSFRVAALLMFAGFTCLLLTFQVSEYGGKPVFFIYVCLLYGFFSGTFALFPTATAKCFGKRNLSINYGIVFTSQAIASPIGVFLSQLLKSSIGYTGLFFLVAGFSFISLLLAAVFKGKDRTGKEI